MKKLLTVSALALTLAISSTAFANNNTTGGFTGPGASTLNITVADALKLKDDAPVILSGKIEKSLGNEKYQFTDGTGIVIVEIDDEDWNGTNVTPEDTIEIRGEIDKDFTKLEIDVDTVTKK